jgi:hypothetical protein
MDEATPRTLTMAEQTPLGLFRHDVQSPRDNHYSQWGPAGSPATRRSGRSGGTPTLEIVNSPAGANV